MQYRILHDVRSQGNVKIHMKTLRLCFYVWLTVHLELNLYSAFGKSLCTYKSCWKWCPRNIVSKNWIEQFHYLSVLYFNRCLTTEYSETTAHLNGKFYTDNQIYVP
jgi:hypothetical protein